MNRFISGWVANSEAVRRYTIEAERVPPEQITVIPNALDLIRFHPRELGVDLARERTRLGLPQGLLFVVVANLRPIKGVDVALEGFAAVAGQTGGAQLILVGEGEEESRLRSRVGALGLQSRVTFLGSREDVPDILRLADVGMLTSRGEGSSNAILEYAASGLPVVATAVGGTPEWVTAADCGRLAPSEDAAALGAALLELAADSDLRRELGGKGRRYVERNHGVEPTLARWVEFLSSMA